MKEDLVGKTKVEAIKLLQKDNIKHRIIKEDGTNFMVTMDFQLNRYNLSIEKGIVTEVRIG
jgi:hypothetical protein